MQQVNRFEQSIPDQVTLRRRSPTQFFVLVFALSIPFWLIGAATNLMLLPGLPVAALGAFCPALAAVILVYRENKRAGVIALLKRSFDFGRTQAKGWYMLAILLMPAVGVVAFVLMRLTGTAVPDPQIALLPTLSLFLVFFISALGEEIGWSGYAIDPLQARWGAFRASLLLGGVWAVWHYVALFQADRSVAWIAWWSLGTIAARVIMVYFYNKTGRHVLVAVLFHTMNNVVWQLFPINGSYFDPRLSGLILCVAIASIFWWERRRAG